MGETGAVRVLQGEEPGEEAEGRGNSKGAKGTVAVSQSTDDRDENEEGEQAAVSIREQIAGQKFRDNTGQPDEHTEGSEYVDTSSCRRIGDGEAPKQQ